jgi:hypothetical protein
MPSPTQMPSLALRHNLRRRLREFNPNVYILPNAVDTIQRQWNAVTPHPKTIGWVGGISHVEDLKLLSGQIKPICEEYGYRFLNVRLSRQ